MNKMLFTWGLLVGVLGAALAVLGLPVGLMSGWWGLLWWGLGAFALGLCAWLAGVAGAVAQATGEAQAAIRRLQDFRDQRDG